MPASMSLRSRTTRCGRSTCRRSIRPSSRSTPARTPGPKGRQPPQPPESTLEDLFCRSENFVAFVNGHEHENDVRPQGCENSVGQNRFVEVTTAAHIDWPQQSRMIELINGSDGKLALALTILDHAGPPNPGGGNAGRQPVKLASIAREISYNDYQHGRGARGAPDDRNVIVQTEKPWPPSP